MKIRLALEFSIERKKKHDTSPEIPEILEFSGATTEIHTQPRYSGFSIPEED